MDFDLTEDQRMIRDAARDFAAREIAPKASRARQERPVAGGNREANG